MKTWLKITGLVLGGGLIFASGTFYGAKCGIKKAVSRVEHCGDLRIDQSEEDESPKLFCELFVPLEKLYNVKFATFKVVNESYIMRKENNRSNGQK